MSELELLFSSQGSSHDQEQIQSEHVASSPLAAMGSRKMRKPPTITPKRFTRFFTPRPTSQESGRMMRTGKSGRQLRDITRNAVNRKNISKEPQSAKALDFQDVENVTPRRDLKRRKLSPIPDSSPVQASSPLKGLGMGQRAVSVFDDGKHLDHAISDDDDVDTIAELCENFRAIPTPIRRLRENGSSRRILQRSFGGSQALGRGRKLDHCSDWQDSTSKFYSIPDDCHTFRGSALPFCTASCNSNSLIAIGDEEGGVRLIDSSGAEGIEFAKKHVSFRPHRNAIMDIAFSSDDYLFATASGDQTARVIDMRTQQIRYIMTGHVSSVKQVRFQPGNDSVLATSSRDGSVQLWDLRCRGSEAPATDFRVSLDPDSDDSRPNPRQVIYSNTCISIKDAHSHTTVAPPRKSGADLFAAKLDSSARRNEVSITALSFLPTGREHLLLTASEANASIKLWDIRAKHSSRRGPATPVSATREPDSHNRHRHYGISSLALSGDGGRLYALCRDSTVYAYSTSHLVLGHAPELATLAPKWRRSSQSSQIGLGPMYGLRHPQLAAASFYVKASVRPARGDKDEMLAVGSRDGCAVLFPTDERHLQKREVAQEGEGSDEDLDDGLPKRPVPGRTTSGLGPSSRWHDSIPIYNHGTALVRAHSSEVTGMAWTADGELITIGDDYMARCWREGPQARNLRLGGEIEGRRWGCGWADVRTGYDDEE